MRKFVYGLALILVALTWTAGFAEFYVIPIGGQRVGTEIKSLPKTITDAGFYYITKNLTSTGDGIIVDADDVTIDLMGFCITGPGGGEAERGIRISDSHSNVEIRNGSIKNWYSGISSGSTTNNIRVFGIRSGPHSHTGIALGGNNHIVMNCLAFQCTSRGIGVDYGSLVKGNQVWNNTTGIRAGAGCMAVGNVAQGNSTGIFGSNGASVIDNSVYSNTNYGIDGQHNCTITRNTGYLNGTTGIRVLNYCTIIGNTVDGLTHGTNCTVVDNTVTPY
jgi:hypothetical protein